jgi:hypothetical protein
MTAQKVAHTQANRDTGPSNGSLQRTSTTSRRYKDPIPELEPIGSNRNSSRNLALVPSTVPRVPVERQLSIGQPDDRSEREADQMAENVMRMSVSQFPGWPPRQAECMRNRTMPFAGDLKTGALRLQRKAKRQSSAYGSIQSPSVNAVLRESGDPLDAAARAFFEPRFGQDFSKVRVHHGDTAEMSARAVDAVAFSVGHHIVFGAGHWNANSQGGRRLLAHELAHTMQQTNAFVVRRRSLLDKAFVFLGFSEGDFSDAELSAYLDGVDAQDKIEDRYDSDNKARAIVRRWMRGNSKFHLSSHQMVLLIREMDTGYVGSEDQEGILDLLTRAENGDLRSIFAPSQINPKDLSGDFGGKRKERLLQFFETRFRGGKAALFGGTVDPIGSSAGAPAFAWNPALFRGKLANPNFRDEELGAELSRLTDTERDVALKDISNERILLQRSLIEAQDKEAIEPDPVKKASLHAAARDLSRRRQHVDQIMQIAFRDIAKVEAPATLLPKTHSPSPPEKAEIGKALRPDLRTLGGVVVPFSRVIIGEAKSYDQKIVDLMPTMVQGYWDTMVRGKEDAQHADPTKVHKLDEFESIANAAKEATDRVFGAYKTGPAFRADRPMPLGRGQLHDLFADTEAAVGAMTPNQKRQMAKALISYFFQSDEDVGEINHHHNADPQFSLTGAPTNVEASLLDSIATTWVGSASHVKQLNEIDRNWDASADPATHEVNIQIFKRPTIPEDRGFFWDMYQTLIHEYIHTLAHPAYLTFAGSFGPESLQDNTLIEGIDSFLTEIVWADAKTQVATPAVRVKVEGPAYAALPFDPSLVPQVFSRRYGSFTQAMKLANVVGVRNIYAAYFLGNTNLIKP